MRLSHCRIEYLGLSLGRELSVVGVINRRIERGSVLLLHLLRLLREWRVLSYWLIRERRLLPYRLLPLLSILLLWFLIGGLVVPEIGDK